MTSFGHFIPVMNVEKLVGKILWWQQIGSKLCNTRDHFCFCSRFIEWVQSGQRIKHLLYHIFHRFVVASERSMDGLRYPIDRNIRKYFIFCKTSFYISV